MRQEQLDLLRQEHALDGDDVVEAEAAMSLTSFITSGIDIEDQQYVYIQVSLILYSK